MKSILGGDKDPTVPSYKGPSPHSSPKRPLSPKRATGMEKMKDVGISIQDPPLFSYIAGNLPNTLETTALVPSSASAQIIYNSHFSGLQVCILCRKMTAILSNSLIFLIQKKN